MHIVTSPRGHSFAARGEAPPRPNLHCLCSYWQVSDVPGAATSQQTHEALMALTSREYPAILAFSALWQLLPADASAADEPDHRDIPCTWPGQGAWSVFGVCAMNSEGRDIRAVLHKDWRKESTLICFNWNGLQDGYSHGSLGQLAAPSNFHALEKPGQDPPL